MTAAEAVAAAIVLAGLALILAGAAGVCWWVAERRAEQAVDAKATAVEAEVLAIGAAPALPVDRATNGADTMLLPRVHPAWAAIEGGRS